MPVKPECSFADPTLAIHPAATLGEPFRTTISTFMPLSRMTSWTGTFCAQTEGRRQKISGVIREIKGCTWNQYTEKHFRRARPGLSHCDKVISR